MERLFTPLETAVFSNVTWGKRGGGQESEGRKWTHLTFTIVHPDGWFKGEKREKESWIGEDESWSMGGRLLL